MNTSGIYKIQSKTNPNKYYIGSAVSIKKRWWTHLTSLRSGKHHSYKLQQWYNQYGEDDLILIILEPCLPEFLIIREQSYLDTLNPFFNICKIAGNTLGYKYSQEVIDKIKESRKGYVPTEETKAKISASLIGNTRSLGYKATEETRKKLSDASKGENNPNYGKTASEETKQKMSEKLRNRVITDETRDKLREKSIGEKNNFYGKKHTEESRKRMSEARKKMFELRRLKLKEKDDGIPAE